MNAKVAAFSTWLLNLLFENPLKFHLLFDALIFVSIFSIFYFLQWETQFFIIIGFCYLSALSGFQFSKMILNNNNPSLKFQKHYRLIAENLNDIVIINHWNNGKTEYVNEAAHAVLGFTQKELLKQPTFVLIHPNDRKKVRNLIEQFNQKRNYFITEKIRVNSKSGHYKWMELRMKPLNNGFGNTKSTIFILRDITETIELEKATKQFADELYMKYLKREQKNKKDPLTPLSMGI